MTPERLSHYRLLAPLGAGGMGVVYRAHDERLERDVALKLLNAESLADPALRERFRRTALAVARVTHPRVGTVFDFGSDHGQDFLVMELVPGESLAARLARGPLPAADATAIATQIAEALEASHELGIVHRDLKPANVMVSARGQVKVLDFELARLLEAGADVTRTASGVVRGSPAYMAPEQILGAPVDGRADLWALGVIVHEMLTGRPPFAGANLAALALAITQQPAPAPAGAPPALARVVARCLEKDPAARFADARELLDALAAAGRPGHAPGDGSIDSIAVLPLENLSGDPAQEFFADGMTEALIDDLAHIAALRVISRTSVMAYKHARRPLPEIAAALGVRAVVEGTALQAGGRVRITARLMDAPSDRALWSGRYERSLGDVLALQSELAEAIAREIRIQLTPQEQARLAARRPVNPEAHLATLQGRHLWNKRTVDSVEASIEHFQRALEIDPDFAPAMAGLADAYHILAGLTSQPGREWATRAIASARRAIALDPTLAEAHAALATCLRESEWDWDGSAAEFQRAIALNPNYASAHQWYAVNLVVRGRFPEAEAEALRAIELDPLSFVHYTQASDVCYFARRYGAAKEYCRRALVFDPDYVAALTDMARAHEELNETEQALALYRRAAALTTSAIPRAGEAFALARAGRGAEARAILAELTAPPGRRVSAFMIGALHARLGDADEAFAWFGRAIDDRAPGLQWLSVHPRLDGLRDDPRFARLLERVGLAPVPLPAAADSAAGPGGGPGPATRA